MDDAKYSMGPEIRKAFLDYDRERRIRLTKIGCIIVLLLMPAGSSLDISLYPAMVLPFLKIRLFVSLLSVVTWLLLTLKSTRKYYIWWGLLLPLMPVVSICWMIYATEGATSPYYAGLLLVIVPTALLLPWTFRENLLVATATVGLYVASCLLHGTIADAGIFYCNLFFLLNPAAMCVIGTFFTSRLRASEFAARWQLNENRRILEESNQKLIELDQIKSRFFANISHELRTPLTLLISPLESLQKTKSSRLDEETKDILTLMHNNAMRLLKLINDLLDLVKLDSKKMEVKKEPFEIQSFLQGLVQSIQRPARDKGLRLTSEISDGLGCLLADQDKLEKIVLNLLFNSIKFTPSGGRIELSAVAEQSSLVIRVKDTGAGISGENLPHIFDRFWQADSSARRKYQGTGIGLALVKELAEVQGGTVEAESRLGRGTTLTVRIPLERTTQTYVEVPLESSVAPAVSEDPATGEWLDKLYHRAELFTDLTPLSETIRRDDFSGSGKPKVLVADDEPDMLKFLRSQLEGHYDILEAVDGNQAVEKVKQFLPDLAILDMMMPEKDGVTACREIKESVSTQAIPVILLTARADEETKMASLEAGASDFLTKPFSTTELHSRVKNLVDSHRFQKDLARQKSALESALEQLKETEGQLVQNEKMVSLGRLSAGLLHEINNPLNYVVTALHILKRKKSQVMEPEREHYNEVLSDIEAGIQRIQRIMGDLHTFIHPKAGVKNSLDLEEVVDAALRFFSQELKDSAKVETSIPRGQKVWADKNKFTHVLINLFQNAIDALKAGKFEGAEPRLLVSSGEKNGRVYIRVRDNGMGIPKEIQDKIFDPFFTTKDVGKGMGLGLSICLKMMQEQGGKITVESEPGRFTEFVLELPARE
jgi:signal transduction histidine kinase